MKDPTRLVQGPFKLVDGGVGHLPRGGWLVRMESVRLDVNDGLEKGALKNPQRKRPCLYEKSSLSLKIAVEVKGASPRQLRLAV